ncbi:MAG: hypothetical protein ABSB63_12135 [Spirochaetia bacterium]|jgi:hypothetical protein
MSNKKSNPSTKKECHAFSFSLNKIQTDYDGQWQGIMVASDGACYFGSSTHSNRQSGGFFRFDPRSRQLETLTLDLSAVCGEDLTKTPPQGKIHSPIVEFDGWLYFTTHMANYWEEAKNAYCGAHVIGYEMITRKFRDFGVVRPRFSIYSAINVDPQRKKLYVFSVPFAPKDISTDGCHLYQIDIPSGAKRDLGRVVEKAQGSCYWFYIDNKGNCWFSLWRGHGRYPDGGHGNLYRVKADSGEIECFKDVLPACELAPDGKPVASDQSIDRSWTWAESLPGRERCLFTMGYLGGDDERVWIFDPGKDLGSGEAFQPVGWVGPTFLGVALGKSRVFYIQRGDAASGRGWFGEIERDKDEYLASRSEDLHVKSISLDPHVRGAVIDHGKIVDDAGRTPRYIDALAADQDGGVYTTGSWHILPGDQCTMQLDWETPVREFHPTKRAQFFAFMDVSEDIQ